MIEGVGEAKASGSAPPVFISYASQDAAFANAMVETLERHGVACWIAPRDVKPGALYADAIVRAIGGARAFVLVLSESAIASSHVGKEIERASSKRRPIYALRLDAAPLTPALEYFLSESQWIEVQAAGVAAACGKLIDAIRETTPAGPQSTVALTPGASADTPSVAHPKSLPNRILLAAGLAVVVTFAALWVDKFWLARRVARIQLTLPAANTVSEKSVAVLPFVDMSEKKDQGYFADGVAQEVHDRLAKVPGLRVVGHASSFRFNSKDSDAASIGAALGVAYLLEGSVRREDARVRVTAQLIEARTGSERWSNRFDSDVVDVLRVQDSIAAELARELQITVEGDTVPRGSVKSLAALDAYLRGLQSEDRQTRESCDAAVAEFRKALTLDPTFAAAAVGLSDTYAVIGQEGWLPTRIAFERARDAALLAQRLDPRSPEPHIELATVYLIYDWNWAGADRELQQAFAMGPRTSNGVLMASLSAAARGRWDDARQLAIEAAELDPLNPAAQVILGWNIYLHTGHFAEAEEAFRRGLQLAPKYGSGRYFLGEALLLEGHQDAALAEFAKETLDDGQLEGSAMALFAAGRKTESDARVTSAIRRNGTSWPSEIARVYAFRGEKDRAFEWLDRAYDARDEDLYLIKDDPLLKNLEGDPRYRAFLHKMKLPE